MGLDKATATPGLEGELRVALHAHDGRVVAVDIGSTRPQVARLLQGRRRDEVAALLPRLFAVCGRSHGAAGALACAAATASLTAPRRAEAAAVVGAELARETGWRVLLEWPRLIDETPDEAAIAAARRLLGASAPDPACKDAVAAAVFGCSAAAFARVQTRAALDAWADHGSTAAARFLRRLRDDETAAPEGTVALLDAHEDAAALRELALAALADPGFASRPTWRGEPAETGALARLQGDALLHDLAGVPRAQARCAARLRELALMLAGEARGAVGALALPDGAGLGWVENARGLLVHAVRAAGPQLERYAIVAPTEWNFHPAGALVSALMGRDATAPTALLAQARRLVQSLDPCVACRVELLDA